MSTWGTRAGRVQPHHRARILARDGGVCQLQYAGCTWHATEVDHVVPLSVLGPDHPMLNDDSNLQAACHSCHARKTRAETEAGRRRSSARRVARKRLPVKPHPGEMR